MDWWKTILRWDAFFVKVSLVNMMEQKDPASCPGKRWAFSSSGKTWNSAGQALGGSHNHPLMSDRGCGRGKYSILGCSIGLILLSRTNIPNSTISNYRKHLPSVEVNERNKTTWKAHQQLYTALRALTPKICGIWMNLVTTHQTKHTQRILWPWNAKQCCYSIGFLCGQETILTE